MKKSLIFAVILSVTGMISVLRAAQPAAQAPEACCDGGACCHGGACCAAR